MADGKLMNQLVLVLLERSSLLYNVKNFSTEVHRLVVEGSLSNSCQLLKTDSSNFGSLSNYNSCRVFSTHLRTLCKLHPPQIVDQYKELLEFAGTTTNIYTKEDFYTHVVSVKIKSFICERISFGGRGGG